MTIQQVCVFDAKPSYIPLGTTTQLWDSLVFLESTQEIRLY